MKTTDWPAAVARDFLLAASNTAPLYGNGEAEGKLVDQDVLLLAKLAKKIQANDGKMIFLLLYYYYSNALTHLRYMDSFIINLI